MASCTAALVVRLPSVFRSEESIRSSNTCFRVRHATSDNGVFETHILSPAPACFSVVITIAAVPTDRSLPKEPRALDRLLLCKALADVFCVLFYDLHLQISVGRSFRLKFLKGEGAPLGTQCPVTGPSKEDVKGPKKASADRPLHLYLLGSGAYSASYCSLPVRLTED